ncbi:MAG: hypothetical protein P4L80_06730 [Xanthobacteraceae bacterium]|nr:hypothetical protein [Xanthobacteraceae bacterium]
MAFQLRPDRGEQRVEQRQVIEVVGFGGEFEGVRIEQLSRFKSGQASPVCWMWAIKEACAGSSKPVVTLPRVALPTQASTKNPTIAAATSRLPIAGIVHSPEAADVAVVGT